MILSSINYEDNISLYKHATILTPKSFCQIVYYHNEDNYNIRVTSLNIPRQ